MVPLRKHNLIGLPVETRSGASLGRIQDFELDPLEQRILRYTVRARRLIGDLLRHDLLVASSQVISLDAEKMVVDDAVRPAEGVSVPSGKPVASAPSSS